MIEVALTLGFGAAPSSNSGTGRLYTRVWDRQKLDRCLLKVKWWAGGGVNEPSDVKDLDSRARSRVTVSSPNISCTVNVTL